MHILAHTYITQKFDTKTCRTVYKNTGGVPTKKECDLQMLRYHFLGDFPMRKFLKTLGRFILYR